MDTPDVGSSTGKMQALKQPVLDVGLTLREAREALGMSVHDVAERIKFAPRQVEALESNDFAHLPQATFLRGFVRSYARVLQLDEVALIAALPTEPAKQVVAKAHAVEVAFPTMQSLRRVNLLWLAGALGIVLVLALFVLLHESEPAAKPAEVVVESVPLPVPEPAMSAVANTEVQFNTPEPEKTVEPKKIPEPVKSVEPKKTAAPVKVVEPKKVAEPNKTFEAKPISEPVKVKPPLVKVTPKTDISATPAVSDKPTATLEILKRRPLHLVFIESTWAEVIDAHGVVLLSRNNQRGSEKWVGGPRHAPYEITIARPANVKLYFRGKEIDLSAYAGMEVAHLRVE